MLFSTGPLMGLIAWKEFVAYPKVVQHQKKHCYSRKKALRKKGHCATVGFPPIILPHRQHMRTPYEYQCREV